MKILVSPDYGAGWSTWSSKSKDVAEYAPIIEFIEGGGDPAELADDGHNLIVQMCEDLGLDYFFCGGARTLRVAHVDGPYRIDEYDGSESVRTAEDFWS